MVESGVSTGPLKRGTRRPRFGGQDFDALAPKGIADLCDVHIDVLSGILNHAGAPELRHVRGYYLARRPDVFGDGLMRERTKPHGSAYRRSQTLGELQQTQHHTLGRLAERQSLQPRIQLCASLDKAGKQSKAKTRIVSDLLLDFVARP